MVNIILILLVIAALIAISILLGKVKALPSKEDIKSLEEKIDNICSNNCKNVYHAKLFDDLSNRSQFIDYWNRFRKHQEACQLWRKLLKILKEKDEVGDTIEACDNWWNENHLYLNEETKNAFTAVIGLACEFKVKHKCNPTNIDEWYDKVYKAGEALSKFPSLV